MSSISVYDTAFHNSNYKRMEYQEDLKYSYETEEVTYDQYKMTYEQGETNTVSDEASEKPSNGWVGRKVLAIPYAIGTGIFLSFIHYLTSYFGTAKERLARSFKASRDIEEAGGYLMTIFSDTYGSYLVERAQHYKKGYDAFLDKLAEKRDVLNAQHTDL